MAKSTADLVNWRALYPAQPRVGNEDWWNTQAKTSADAMDTINRMPYVFDPRAFAGQSTAQIGQAIQPMGRGQVNFNGANSNSNLSGLLQMLSGFGGLPLLAGLAQSNPTALQQLLSPTQTTASNTVPTTGGR